MGFLSKILGGSIKDTLGGVGELLGKFITDPQKKLEASLELTKLQHDLEMKLVDADLEYAKAQAEVIKTEVGSASWMARSWRPSLMFVFIALIAFNYLIAPIASLQTVPVPPQMWEILKIGLGGYIVGRSGEKIADSLAKK